MTGRPRTLGIVGTMVRDRIVPVDGAPVEGWGGIGYAAAAAAATLSPEWTLRVVARVGADVLDDVRRVLEALPRCEARLTTVPELNNRVELRYHDAERRTETLSGGVSGWRADELGPELAECDAVLLNFISGHELDLAGARAVCGSLDVPVYADLHSLFLGTEPDGSRTPRPLGDWRGWVSCFEHVQMNEDEFALLTGATDGPRALPELIDAGPSLVVITRGGDGATIAYREGGRTLVREVTLLRPRSGDPTGCGDVWGAVMFSRMLAGDGEVAAAEVANRVAAASLDHYGVEGLVDRLADVPLSGGAGAYLDSATEVEL